MTFWAGAAWAAEAGSYDDAIQPLAGQHAARVFV